MSVMFNGDIVISTKQKELHIYKTDQTLQQYYSFEPLYTLGVCVNNDDEIVVGSMKKTYLMLL